MALNAESVADIDRFFTAIKRLNELDRSEIRNVVGGILAPTEREKHFTLNYHRAAINIEFLLETMKDTKQFQAITAVARSVLETAAEVRMMAEDVNSAEKVSLFTELEKLRSAKRMASFNARFPNTRIEARSYEQFVIANEQRIEQKKDQMWPGQKRVKHWTLKSMEGRCKHLGTDFQKLYDLHYAHLSWYIHSGVTGVSNVQAETLALLCGTAFNLIMECYGLILESIVNEFKIYNADDKLKNKITLAKMLPFVDSQNEVDVLRRVLLGANY